MNSQERAEKIVHEISYGGKITREKAIEFVTAQIEEAKMEVITFERKQAKLYMDQAFENGFKSVTEKGLDVSTLLARLEATTQCLEEVLSHGKSDDCDKCKPYIERWRESCGVK